MVKRARNIDGQAVAGKPDPAVEVYHRTPPCSISGCEAKGACKVKTRTGWANFCAKHYEAYWSAPNFGIHLAEAMRRIENPHLAEIRAAMQRKKEQR